MPSHRLFIEILPDLLSTRETKILGDKNESNTRIRGMSCSILGVVGVIEVIKSTQHPRDLSEEKRGRRRYKSQ